MIGLKKENREEKSYKIARWLLIILAVVSIQMDGHKMYEEIKRSKIYIDTSLYEVVQFYSATISLHSVSLTSALEHEMWITICSRLLAALIYQLEIDSRKNETLPEDPQQAEKLLRKKYPHKYQSLGEKKVNLKRSRTPKKSGKSKKSQSSKSPVKG